MTTPRQKVYDAIDVERRFQDHRWGSLEIRRHEVGGWLTMMRVWLNKAEVAWAACSHDGLVLDELRKVVAIGVACMEQHGIEHRHPSDFEERRNES